MRGGGGSGQMRRSASDQYLKGRVLTRADSSPGSSVRGSDNDSEEFVEVTLDIEDDHTIVLRSVEPASDQIPESVVTPASTRSNATSRSPSIRRTSSSKILQFSQELKAEAVAIAKQFSQDLKAKLSRTHSRDTAGNGTGGNGVGGGARSGIESALQARNERKRQAQLDRTKSGAHKALRGLRFISGNRANSWEEVQRNFDLLSSRDGYLSRSDFAQCIGMTESREFAVQLFDTLSRRRRTKVDKICKDELKEIWSQITDQSFDSRLQIFFEMVDKNADGRITGAEVKEIIMLSASACKLSRLKEQADEYAALIMEELDPEELGYIEVLTQ